MAEDTAPSVGVVQDEVQPVAWRVALLDAEGREVTGHFTLTSRNLHLYPTEPYDDGERYAVTPLVPLSALRSSEQQNAALVSLVEKLGTPEMLEGMAHAVEARRQDWTAPDGTAVGIPLWLMGLAHELRALPVAPAPTASEQRIATLEADVEAHKDALRAWRRSLDERQLMHFWEVESVEELAETHGTAHIKALTEASRLTRPLLEPDALRAALGDGGNAGQQGEPERPVVCHICREPLGSDGRCTTIYRRDPRAKCMGYFLPGEPGHVAPSSDEVSHAG